MKQASSWLLLLLSIPLTAWADVRDPSEPSKISEIFSTANVAASRGDHARAIGGYLELTAAGIRDPDVYFNLATSFAQAGDYPRAILNYERALVLRPGDAKAADGLRNAERALEESRALVEGEASIQRSRSISDALYQRFEENSLAYGLLVATWLFFGVLAWVWVSGRRGPRVHVPLVLSGLLLGFSAVGLATKAGALRDGPRAVAVDDRVTLREGPDPRARTRGEARGGDRGEILAVDRNFARFRVVGGLEGWTAVESVGLVDVTDTTH